MPSVGLCLHQDPYFAQARQCRLIVRVPAQDIEQQVLGCLHVTALVQQEHGLGDVIGRLQGVELARAIEHRQRLVAPRRRFVQHHGQTVITLGRVGAQLQAAPVIRLRRCKVRECLHGCTREISLAMVRIHRQCALDQTQTIGQRSLEARLPVLCHVVLGEEHPGFRQSDVAGGKIRVELDGALQLFDRLLHIGHAVSGQERSGLQICQVGIQVLRTLPFHARHRILIERQFQGARHLERDLVLHGEDIAGPSVEAHGPHVRAGLRINQLRGDAQARAIALHAALEQVVRFQQAADLAGILRAPRKLNDDVREMTSSCCRLANWCSTDSAIPCASTAPSVAVLTFSNGNTATVARSRKPTTPGCLATR